MLLTLTIGMLANGVYNDAFAANTPIQTAGNQLIAMCKLTKEDAANILESMGDCWDLIIPEKYTSIDCDDAFMFSGIESIDFNNVKSICGGAFSENYNLLSVDLKNVTHIGGEAFCLCEYLKAVDLKNVQYIGYRAFKECRGLESIIIPNSVSCILEGAFSYINPEAKFVVASKGLAKYLVSKHGITNHIDVVEKPEDANAWKWPETGELVIPDGVTRIDKDMFKQRNDIRSIELPDTVTSIGVSAFGECIGLTYIDLNNVQVVGGSAFSGCTWLKNVYMENVKTIGRRAFGQCDELDSITISDKIESIHEYAFRLCRKLPNVTVKCNADSLSVKDRARIYNLLNKCGIDAGKIKFIDNYGNEVSTPTE